MKEDYEDYLGKDFGQSAVAERKALNEQRAAAQAEGRQYSKQSKRPILRKRQIRKSEQEAEKQREQETRNWFRINASKGIDAANTAYDANNNYEYRSVLPTAGVVAEKSGWLGRNIFGRKTTGRIADFSNHRFRRQSVRDREAAKMDANGYLMNEDAIREYYKRKGIKDPYLMFNKTDAKLSVGNGDPNEEYPITMGAVEGDYWGKTNMEPDIEKTYKGREKGKYRSVKRTSGAGIFTLRGNANENARSYTNREAPKGEPALNFRTETGEATPMFFHTPAGDDRLDALYNGNSRVSYGCFSSIPGVITRLINEGKMKDGTKAYVIPEEGGNSISIDPESGELITTFDTQHPEYKTWYGRYKSHYNTSK